MYYYIFKTISKILQRQEFTVEEDQITVTKEGDKKDVKIEDKDIEKDIDKDIDKYKAKIKEIYKQTSELDKYIIGTLNNRNIATLYTKMILNMYDKDDDDKTYNSEDTIFKPIASFIETNEQLTSTKSDKSLTIITQLKNVIEKYYKEMLKLSINELYLALTHYGVYILNEYNQINILNALFTKAKQEIETH